MRSLTIWRGIRTYSLPLRLERVTSDAPLLQHAAVHQRLSPFPSSLHPLQVAPFMAWKLIQRFTSSNPSPRYVRAAVQGAPQLQLWPCTPHPRPYLTPAPTLTLTEHPPLGFRTGTYDGRTFSGAYGDMGALFAAIILDREARSTTLDADPTHGQLREPALKLMHVLRSFNFGHPKLQHFEAGSASIGQYHMHSPTVYAGRPRSLDLCTGSCLLMPSRCQPRGPAIETRHRSFNFYDPLYQPEGPVSEAGLISPEAELGTGPYVVNFLNAMTSAIRSSWARGSVNDRWDTSGIDMNDANAVVTELDLLLTGGRLNRHSRSVITLSYERALSELDSQGLPTGTTSEALRRAQELFLFAAEFHSTNLLRNRDVQRAKLQSIPSQGRPYRAIVYIFLDGGADSFNLMVPTGGCTGGEGTDLWAQWAEERGSNAIPAATLLPITADAAYQPCSQFGLHPDMLTLQREYNNGDAAMIANVGPLVQPVTKRTLANGAPRPPSLYSHNTQRLTAQNVHAQASSSAKGVIGRMLAALAAEQPSGLPPHRVKSYSIAGNTKILEGSPEAPNIVSDTGPVRLSRYADVWSDVDNLVTTEADSIFGETYAQIVQKAVVGAEELQVRSTRLPELQSAPTLLMPRWSVRPTHARGCVALRIGQTYLNAPGAAVSSAWTGTGTVAAQLRVVANIIGARALTESERDVFFISYGGWDTHGSIDFPAPASGEYPGKWSTVDQGLSPFIDEMKRLGLWDNGTRSMARAGVACRQISARCDSRPCAADSGARLPPGQSSHSHRYHGLRVWSVDLRQWRWHRPWLGRRQLCHGRRSPGRPDSWAVPERHLGRLRGARSACDDPDHVV